jgi:Xaa-Pro aminopeptidase
MFQSFDDSSDSSQSALRLNALRAQFAALGIDGVLVPRGDEHQGEYVAPSSERLRFLTGFTGSAGVALVLKNRCVLFVDGRYKLQAPQQTDQQLVEVADLVAESPLGWLKAKGQGLTIGFDPWLHTAAEIERLEKAAAQHNFKLKALGANLIDAIWQGRPKPPTAKIVSHPSRFAGETSADKLGRLEQALTKEGADAALISDPSAISWAFNLRGRDIAHVPVALGFAVLRKGKPAWLYWPKSRIAADLQNALSGIAEFRPREKLIDDLVGLAKSGLALLLDPAQTPSAIMTAVKSVDAKIISARDPIVLMRAQKNPVEVEGARLAQRRDGAAMVTFLAWLDKQKPGSVDEISAVKKLEQCRRSAAQQAGMKLEDISFDTISGSGPNGAIVHYRVTEASNRSLSDGELFLIDSGGQYLDGTTDITRTVAIGVPTDEMKRSFTLVLKGMIAISRARFPEGTRGVDLDVLARDALWQHGLDYAHGTGHGVGSFLSVHEGPQGISKRAMEPLLQGMILSNEPGFYKTGAYGIRIENLILVEAAQKPEGGETAMHAFETLTLCPIDRRLIDSELLERSELKWLDAYHQRICAELSPLVSPSTRAWLKRATKALPKKRKR